MTSLALAANPASQPTTSRLITANNEELPLRALSLRCQAGAGFAQVVVEQTFMNPYEHPLEVKYQLPLPADAAVGAFSFRLGERRVTGEIEALKEARERYEEALFEGKTASLLEQERAGLFTQSLGNLPAGEEVRVEVTIDQPLVWRDGQWEWRFPTVVAPRYTDSQTKDSERVAVAVADAPLAARLAMQLHIEDRLTGRPCSPSHSLEFDEEGARVSLKRCRLDRDLVVRWPVATQEPGVQHRFGSAEAKEESGQFALLTVVPPSSPRESISRDLIVLIDTSGSMGGAPLEQARAAIQALIAGLSKRDTLELLSFGTKVERWRPRPKAMSPKAKREALRWLADCEASGCTDMDAGIEQALAGIRADSQRQVLLVSDGHIGFENRIVCMVREGLEAQSRLHVLGVGGSVNRSLTRPLARVGAGHEEILGLSEDVEPGIERLVKRMLQPQVVNLKLEGSALVEASPQRLPDLFAGAPARIAVRVKPGRLVLRGKSAEGLWEHVLEVPHTMQPNHSMARYWAREQVEDLEAAAAESYRDAAIEALGINWGIVTRLTAFVAVSDEQTVDPGQPSRSYSIPHELPAGMSAESLGLRPLEIAPRHAKMAPRHADRVCASRLPPRINRMERHLVHASPIKHWDPPQQLVAERLRVKAGLLRLQVTLQQAADWALEPEVTVWLADGTETTLAVVFETSTIDGFYETGDILRLVLRGEQALLETVVRLEVNELQILVGPDDGR